MTLISRCSRKAFTEGCSLLYRKPVKFHGINPTLRYGSHEIPLPRFCTEEMKTAVQMNKNVVRSVKSPAKRGYPKATKEDLRRLTSETIEDSYARVEWTNPKDGKVYNILKQGETEDGKIAVRILDSEGAFIKEAELTPKTIGIPDDYVNPNYCTELGLTHGDISLLFAKRHNPFAQYVTFNISKADIARKRELDGVIEYMDKGGKLDYLSCSYGFTTEGKRKTKIQIPSIEKMMEKERHYDRIAERGTRVLNSAGNATEAEMPNISNFAEQHLLTNKKVEGVGSLNPKTGRISDFSLSRNSELTQHYEVGEYAPTITRHGVNLTGLPGTDFRPSSRLILEDTQNPLLGQSAEKVARIRKAIDDRLKDLQQASMKLFERRLPFNELKVELDKINQAKHIYNQRRIKLLNYSYDLVERDGKVYQSLIEPLTGTSIAAPIRTAKLALNDMLEGIL